MNSENESILPATLPQGRFSGRNEFAELVRQAFAAAAIQGWREIMVCDADFADWPLGERAFIQALGDWSRTGRQFTMIASNYDEIPRKHARFVSWRRSWAHIVECRSCAADKLPSALWSSNWVFERMDVQRCSGVAGPEAGRRIALRERLSERLLHSSPAFAATTLGL
ncbi:MAG: hypothetical protein ABIR35_03200 [Polaromonas sp.]